MNVKSFFGALALVALAAGCASTPEFKCVPQRNVTLLEGSVLIDVRTQKDYDAKHIEGAILIPHDRMKERIAAAVPDKNALIYLYCGSGRRAEKAIKTLNSLGYRNVINLCGISAAEISLKK